MKTALAILGILCVLVGTCSGVINWYLTEYYLETVGWSGPMLDVNRIAWVVNILGMGLGGVLIGFAALMRSRSH